MPITLVEGRRVSLSNLDKVLYPGTGTTKGELLHYYASVASALLPHLRDRPMSFVRYPDGPDGQIFVTKHLPPGTPTWVHTTQTPSKSQESIRQVLVQDLPTLVWAANLVAELHTPQWREDDPGMADRLVVDLDPGAPADILTCRDAALLMRERLAADGLTAYAKTSGSKGLHLLVPITPTPSAQVTAYAKRLAQELADAHPGLLVATMAKRERPGHVFVDFSQNAAAKTTASPYTVRARRTPTVSAPVSWDELEAAGDAAELSFTIDDMPARMDEHGDLMAALLNPRRAGVVPGTGVGSGTGADSGAGAGPSTGSGDSKISKNSKNSGDSRGPKDSAGGGSATPSRAFPLEPPLAVMRPKAVHEVPAEDALPGGTQYSIKLDGWRALAFARGGAPAVLQSRSGRDLAPDFPKIAAAVAALPQGVVLDGELCAWHEGRFAFGQLVRSARARTRDSVQVSYVAFDLLAVPEHDVRALPLRERWDLLTTLLADAEPPLQIVMATNDRAEAVSWRAALAPTGVEGLVAKGLDTPYRPQLRRGWLKIRDADTVDATVVGFTGTPRRPRTLLTRLDDGTEALTSPQLDARQATEVASAAAHRTHDAVDHPEHGRIHRTDPLPAEVLRDPGRTPYVRFIRLRGD